MDELIYIRAVRIQYVLSVNIALGRARRKDAGKSHGEIFILSIPCRTSPNASTELTRVFLIFFLSFKKMRRH